MRAHFAHTAALLRFRARVRLRYQITTLETTPEDLPRLSSNA